MGLSDAPRNKDLWTNNPFTRPPQDLSRMLDWNQMVSRGMAVNRVVLAKSTFMDPLQAKRYSNWASEHPTVDPRTWGPLADAGLNPHDYEMSSLAEADVMQQVAEGRYGRTVGEKWEPPKRTRNKAVEEAADETSSSGFFSSLGGMLGGVASAATPDFVGDAVGFAGDAASETYGAVKASARTAITALSAPLQAANAANRTRLGNIAAAERIAEKRGLDPEVFKTLTTTQPNEALSGLPGAIPLPGAGSNPITDFFLDNHTAVADPDTVAKILAERGMSDQLGAYNEAITAFQNQRNDNPLEQAKSNALQTEAGQTIQSFHDKTPGNLLTGTYEEGAVKDPKSGKWVILDAHGQVVRDAEQENEEGWLPNQVGQVQAEAQAVKAYDITTAAEKASGVAPTAWTLGRGIAHTWYEPNTTAFNALSGFVDFHESLLLDPVNLIPVGAAGKLIKPLRYGSGAAKAFAGKGEKLVVSAPTYGAAGTSRTIGDAAGAAAGAKLANPLIAEGAEQVLDPQLAARGARFVGGRVMQDLADETGLISTPHSKYVMLDTAWSWLSHGRGQRFVDQMVDETSVANIMLRSNGKIDYALARELADSTSPAEVRAVIGPRLGVDLTDPSQIGSIGGRAPVLSKVPLIGSSLAPDRAFAGKELAGGGVFTKAGRQASAYNLREFGALGATRGMFRRPFRMAPSSGNGFDQEDLDSAFTEITNFMRGTRTREEKWLPIAEKYLRARNGAERYRYLYKEGGLLHTVIKENLVEKGLTEADAQNLTRAFAGGIDEEMRNYLVTDLGLGELSNGNKALLVSEILSRSAHLPDYRTLSRVTSALGNIRRLPGGADADKAVADALHHFTNGWRQAVLIRPAYTMRDVGEMAFAMSLAGGDGAFTNPYAFIANMTSVANAAEMTTRTGRIFAKIVGMPMKGGKFAIDRLGRWGVRGKDDSFRGLTSQEIADVVAKMPAPDARDLIEHSEGLRNLMPSFDQKWARINGQPFFDDMNRVLAGEDVDLSPMFDQMSSVHGNFWIDEPASRAAGRSLTAFHRDDLAHRAEYSEQLIAKMRKASRDQLMRDIANPNVKRREMIARWKESGVKVMQTEMRDDILDGTTKKDNDYIKLYESIVQRLTLGDSALLDAITTGKFEGKILDGNNTALKDYLDNMLSDDNYRLQLPEELHGDPFRNRGHEFLRKQAQNFFAMNGDFADLFARGPMIRQAYVERVLQLAPHMSAEAKAAVVQSLREVGDVKLARQVMDTRTVKGGVLGVEEVDAIASGYARKKMSKVFYDAHKRQNYALAFRVLAPFAQATFNTFRRWGELSLKNPQMMYRTTKPIEALTDPGSAALYDILGTVTGDEALKDFYTPNHPEASVNGFFFNNSYGDRIFAYPLIGKLVDLLPGVPEGFIATSNAESLNVAGMQVNPGTGPILTLPASLVTGDMIYEDSTRGQIMRWLFPYGLPEGSLADKIFNSITPTAFRKLNLATDTTAQGTSVIRTMAVLATSGRYDLHSRADVRRMANDAKHISTTLTGYAAIFGMLTPSTFNFSIAPELFGEDADGTGRMFMLQDKLTTEFNNYIAPKSPETAQQDYGNGFMQFVHDYGYTALFAVLPMTETTGDNIGMQPTNDVWAWRTDNQEAYDQHRPVIGLFFPGGDPSSEFSEELYRWQKADAQRRPKSPEDFIFDVNKQLAWALYVRQNEKLMAQVPDPEAQTPIRDQIKSDLQHRFPGFTGQAEDLGRFDDRMLEVAEAVKNEDIRSLDGTRFIADYLRTRDKAIDQLHDMGYSKDLTTEQAAPVRAALLQHASSLIQHDNSGVFINIWTRLFASEFESG